MQECSLHTDSTSPAGHADTDMPRGSASHQGFCSGFDGVLPQPTSRGGREHSPCRRVSGATAHPVCSGWRLAWMGLCASRGCGACSSCPGQPCLPPGCGPGSSRTRRELVWLLWMVASPAPIPPEPFDSQDSLRPFPRCLLSAISLLLRVEVFPDCLPCSRVASQRGCPAYQSTCWR